MATIINDLPEELLLNVLSYLDSESPSSIHIRKEPSLALTTSALKNYKNISRVSRRWRRIVLPLLFRFSRLRLDIAPRQEWTQCHVCGTCNTNGQIQDTSLHAQLFSSAIGSVTGSQTPQTRASGTTFDRTESLTWAARFHHALQDYLCFLRDNKLEPSVQSFVLETDRTIPGQGRYPHRLAAGEDHRFQAAAVFWVELLSVIDPSRIVVVAPPADLACLTNCAIDLFGEWAFSDMDYHILELCVNGNRFGCGAAGVAGHIDLESIKHVPAQHPGVADSSILRLKAWTHLSLNEGSFLCV